MPSPDLLHLNPQMGLGALMTQKSLAPLPNPACGASGLQALLRQGGLDEGQLDAEIRESLAVAAEVAEGHEGVASVLLAALEPQVGG